MSSDIMTTARLSKAVRMYNRGPRFLLGMTVEFPSGLILSGCVEPETWLRYFGLERATRAQIVGKAYTTRNLDESFIPFTITKKAVEEPAAPEAITIWEVFPASRSHHELIERAIRPVMPADWSGMETVIPDDGTLPWGDDDAIYWWLRTHIS